ncbi:MAG: phosphomannomutase/phosphoglucomutase [Solirubrobacterales bacterium]|nr:phosphomannomutase/phosphoglucomutase [Solirubrobacterales bacterium]
MANLDPAIFKAYDIRGLARDQIDVDAARSIGRAFARVLASQYGCSASELTIGLGRDMRNEAKELAESYVEGLVAEGVAVIDAGQVATEQLYFLVGSRSLDGGLMSTASHNPARYTGAKLVGRGALPLSGDRGIQEIRRAIESGLPEESGGGSVENVDLSLEFTEWMGRFLGDEPLRPLRVVVDGGNGMAGPMISPLLEDSGVELIVNYWVPDGNFPDHEPNPLLEENRQFIIDAVVREQADLGIAWDGDADRCFFIDEQGRFVDGDFLTALLAKSMLKHHPGSTVLYDVRASRAVADSVTAAGGTALVNRVGHAFFKARMREIPEAVFGGEVSGHYYFRDFWCADSGSIPALLVLRMLSDSGSKMSELLAPFHAKYFISGEVNSEVEDATSRIKAVESAYSDAEITKLDGISVDYADWHFNVRSSNTEPLLRLCLESLISFEDMEARRDAVLDLLRKPE